LKIAFDESDKFSEKPLQILRQFYRSASDGGSCQNRQSVSRMGYVPFTMRSQPQGAVHHAGGFTWLRRPIPAGAAAWQGASAASLAFA
jgi:hypothetical protein